MKTFTRFLKLESEKDLQKINYHNNHSINKRTYEQNMQAYNDKLSYYNDKWNNFLMRVETDVQKSYCNEMIKRVNNMEKWF